MKKNKLLALAILLTPFVEACDNSSLHDVSGENKELGISKTDPYMVYTDKGEVIVLADTITRSYDSMEDYAKSINKSKAYRYESTATVYGYDNITAGKYYKVKWTNPGFGLVANRVYVARDETYQKNLPKADAADRIMEADYGDYPGDAMGWTKVDTKFEVGYHLASVSYTDHEVGETMIRFIKCDAYGASVNLHTPCTPESLVWHYEIYKKK